MTLTAAKLPAIRARLSGWASRRGRTQAVQILTTSGTVSLAATKLPAIRARLNGSTGGRRRAHPLHVMTAGTRMALAATKLPPGRARRRRWAGRCRGQPLTVGAASGVTDSRPALRRHLGRRHIAAAPALTAAEGAIGRRLCVVAAGPGLLVTRRAAPLALRCPRAALLATPGSGRQHDREYGHAGCDAGRGVGVAGRRLAIARSGAVVGQDRPGPADDEQQG